MSRCAFNGLVGWFVCWLAWWCVVVSVGSTAEAAPCWTPPVVGRVVDPFREPSCPYCAGNRGLEYEVGAGVVVRAVAAGVVSWSGSIAGVRHVVVRHGDDRRATYGKLVSTQLRAGDRVVAGMRVGTASGVFYFGLREQNRYIDPMPFLSRLVGRPRLVPTDASRPRPAPAPRLSCP